MEPCLHTNPAHRSNLSMETVKKNWLGWIVSLMISIFTVIISLSLTDKSKEAYDIKVDLKSKVDRSEFIKHCDKNDQDFSTIQNNQSIYLEKSNELLNKLVEQNAKMSTDIEWIKRKIQ